MKQVIIGSIIALILSVGFTLYHGGSETVVERMVGGASGSKFSNPDLSVGGVQRWFYRMPLSPATSTPCVFKSPTTASSTLLAASVNILTGTTTVTTVVIAKAAAGVYATTTSIGTFGVPITGRMSGMASTTPTVGSAQIFAPGSNLVVGISSDTNLTNGGAITEVGSCTATFQEI